MKNFTLKTVFTVAVLGMFFSNEINAQEEVLRRNQNLNIDAPFEFEEKGIVFYVFTDGTFDFNTQPHIATTTTYVMRRGNSALANEPRGIRIDRDRFGNIRRIGNTFINYDRLNRVVRIGSIFMEYSRKGLVQIGGLSIQYNRNGNIVGTFGTIQRNRNNSWTSSGNYYYGPAHPHNNSVSYVYRADGTRDYDRK
jgi:hypothetical protein